MRGEGKATTGLISAAVGILKAENPMTVRQLFYRLVGAGLINNTKQEYQRVSRCMTIARKDGRCDYSWIVDRSRPEYEPNVWKDAAGYFEAVKRSYHRDYWQDQPCHVEVWTEKDAIIGSIEPVTHEMGVIVRVFRGFSSTTRANEVAQLFATVRDKNIHVLYLGDHDPSGIDIERDIHKRVSEFGAASRFSVKRVAIHAADIARFNLPPQQVKDTDSRHKSFLTKHGDKCVELDALPPTELRRRLTTEIEGLINPGPWNHHLEIEKMERNSILDFADQISRLTRAEGPQ